jgi:hypothetical protein
MASGRELLVVLHLMELFASQDNELISTQGFDEIRRSFELEFPQVEESVI